MHMETIALLRTQSGKRRHRVLAQELEFGQEWHENSVFPLMGLRGIGGAGGGGGWVGGGPLLCTCTLCPYLRPSSPPTAPPVRSFPPLSPPPFSSLLPSFTARRCAGLGRADAHTSRWRD